MTEEKGKRRYWRRRPRRKVAGADGAVPPADPQAALFAGEGDSSGEGEAPGEASAEAVSPPSGAADSVPDGGQEGQPPPETLEVERMIKGDAAEKSRRRRPRRRRGKGGHPAQAESTPDAVSMEGGVAPVVEEGPAHDDAMPSLENERTVEETAAVTESPQEGDEALTPTAAHQGDSAGAVKKGRRRGRRRGRRKGKGSPQPAGEMPVSAVPPAGEEFDGGAEGTSSEEQALVREPMETSGADEEEGEETATETGKGPRKVMLIDGMHREEIRVAFVSEGVLDYFEVENQRRKAFKGNIYKGKVVNVAQAIEAAFVEFGGGRHGFLPLNEYCGGALMENLGTWNEGDKRPHLRPGTEILVQVTKEESSIKGAALTSYISIAGRYLVMMLGMKRYGISKKITGEKERERIRKQMEKLDYPEHLGFIVRTVGAGQPIKDLKADLENLLKLWDRTVAGARTQKAPSLLYEEQDIVVRTLRDNYSPDVAEVLMNSDDSYRKAQAFFDVYYPQQKQKLKVIHQKRPLFFRFNIEEQLERACARKVPLPSGGHIVIDRTEALWSIDVNSGRSAKDRDIEDTAFRTNKEAAVETARQLRIRDMGGLIVVDFIDMENRRHIKDVEKILKDALKLDKAKSDVSAMGKFGLVGISRQRMGISFYDVMLKGCDACGGTGALPSMDSMIVRLLRKVQSELSKDQVSEVAVRVSPPLLEALFNQKREDVTALERNCGGHIVFTADPSLPNGSFTVGEGTA